MNSKRSCGAAARRGAKRARARSGRAGEPHVRAVRRVRGARDGGGAAGAGAAARGAPHAAEFPAVWSELRTSGALCDGTVRCGDGCVLRVHRAILSAASPYFRALFTSPLRRGAETSEARVEAPSEYMTLLLDYAYTGACRVTAANVERLLPIADRLEVVGVVQLCCEFLSRELRAHNCLGIERFARAYSCDTLAAQAAAYARRSFAAVRACGEFARLAAGEVRALLAHDELAARSERDVFEAVRAWVLREPRARLRHLPDLLGCVRYAHLDAPYFHNEVMRWKCILEDENQYAWDAAPPVYSGLGSVRNPRSSSKDWACMRALGEVRAYMGARASGARPTALPSALSRPRAPHDVLFAVGGWSAGSPTGFVETYDTRADRWLVCASAEGCARAYHGLAALGGTLYAVGGFDGSEHFNSVRRYDPEARAWTERACMYQPRCYVSVVAHDGLIYALGGYNGRTRMNSAERYHPSRNQWELIAPMHKQRSDASAASLGDKIYIVGGFNGVEVLSSAESYQPSTNQWTFIRSMLSPRSGVSLVAYRDALYALGGFNGFSRLNTGEKLCPSCGGDWQPIPEMFSARSNFATAILDDMIFVIGGFNGSTTIPLVECYDGNTNEWFGAAPMNLNRSALSAAVLCALPNAREYSYLARLDAGSVAPL